MDGKKYLAGLVLVLAVYSSKAQQVKSFAEADSTSAALYLSGDWKQLSDFSRQAINSGFDFPALRNRVAYAQFITGNYSGAFKSYNIALSSDSYNQTARYYAYLCQKYLNHNLEASYQLAHLDSGQVKDEKLNPFGLIIAGLETGLKFPQNVHRGTATYSRISLANRLGWRLQLDQSVVFFNQRVTNTVTTETPIIRFGNDEIISSITVTYPDRQLEYYAKLSYSISKDLILLGAWHYLNTGYQNTTYNSDIGLAGIKYAATYFDAQADVNWGPMIGHHIIQYNAQLMLYPLGNLNFYTISRLSSLNQNGKNQSIFSQALGVKLLKNTWIETSATFGDLDNYSDADGLYIYNTIDASKLKLAETIFYQLSTHAQLQLNYTFERKQDIDQNLNYSQNSITGGILWKF